MSIVSIIGLSHSLDQEYISMTRLRSKTSQTELFTMYIHVHQLSPFKYPTDSIDIIISSRPRILAIQHIVATLTSY